jgi:hypothetical protein
MVLDSNYWDIRYQAEQTGWDIGYVSTPLKEYIDQLDNKGQKILIPGAGNAYEAEYLHEKGFGNVYIIEWSETAIDRFFGRYPGFPKENIFLQDFFDHKGKYDLIIEQTFFCSVHPSKRIDYTVKMHNLLKPGGKLVGLLFDDELYKDKPPYGGSKDEYDIYFREYFTYKVFETANNSIKPRAGRELFINLVKKT